MSVSGPLTGLTPSSLYHFRLVASNSAGTATGPDLTFTTLAAQLLVAPAFLPGGSFQFAISNLDGTPITAAQQSRIAVYATTNLALPLSNWTLLTNAAWLTNGFLQVTDPVGSLVSQKYYRTLQRP